MPVMKAQESSRVRQTAIVMDLSDIEADASQVLIQARAQAEFAMAEARATAQSEALKIREDARKAGHAEGFKTGFAEGTKQGHDEAVAKVSHILQKLVEHWAGMLDTFHANMPLHQAEAKTDLIRLALAIARKVVGGEALKNPHVAETTLAETLRLIGTARLVTLQVNPEELASLEKYLPALVAKIKTIGSVEIQPDETVTVGGCIAKFGAGEVDSRLETQLQRITDELLAEGES